MFDFLKRIFKPVVFEIRIKKGRADIIKGKVTRAFVNECSEICKLEKVENISILGLDSENGIRLEFSANTTKECRQKFRNIWGIYK